MMKTNPMYYVFLDGCGAAGQDNSMLAAFTGVNRILTRAECINAGANPGFALGWSGEKKFYYVREGTLYRPHFYFVDDYYKHLTERDLNTGLTRFTYLESVAFAKSPLGMGVDRSVMHNPEGKGAVYVGCAGCFFDEL